MTCPDCNKSTREGDATAAPAEPVADDPQVGDPFVELQRLAARMSEAGCEKWAARLRGWATMATNVADMLAKEREAFKAGRLQWKIAAEAATRRAESAEAERDDRYSREGMLTLLARAEKAEKALALAAPTAPDANPWRDAALISEGYRAALAARAPAEGVHIPTLATLASALRKVAPDLVDEFINRAALALTQEQHHDDESDGRRPRGLAGEGNGDHVQARRGDGAQGCDRAGEHDAGLLHPQQHADCGGGNAPRVNGSGALAAPTAPDAVLEQEREKFQRETLRTSAQAQLLMRWMARAESMGCRHEQWVKACDTCTLLRETKALLAGSEKESGNG